MFKHGENKPGFKTFFECNSSCGAFVGYSSKSIRRHLRFFKRDGERKIGDRLGQSNQTHFDSLLFECQLPVKSFIDD